VPRAQTCCGQPAYNQGDRADAASLAKQTMAAMEGYDYVVAPSGSCAAMLKVHYPELFEPGSADGARAIALAERTFELVQFLVEVMGVEVAARWPATAIYHDSCSGLRELGIKAAPRRLLTGVRDLQLIDLPGAEVCCGFGGTFCVKYPDISAKMVEDKAAEIEASGADLVLAGDLGCLMNIAGRLRRRGSRVEVRHVAEVLAGADHTAPIAAPASRKIVAPASRATATPARRE
jgi:L-lactate dehydrogenase complex protein LldE